MVKIADLRNEEIGSLTLTIERGILAAEPGIASSFNPKPSKSEPYLPDDRQLVFRRISRNLVRRCTGVLIGSTKRRLIRCILRKLRERSPNSTRIGRRPRRRLSMLSRIFRWAKERFFISLPCRASARLDWPEILRHFSGFPNRMFVRPTAVTDRCDAIFTRSPSNRSLKIILEHCVSGKAARWFGSRYGSWPMPRHWKKQLPSCLSWQKSVWPKFSNTGTLSCVSATAPRAPSLPYSRWASSAAASLITAPMSILSFFTATMASSLRACRITNGSTG